MQRGLEVVEFACGIPHAMKGEYTEGAGPGIDVYSMRQPLGVAAGITPFNFPAMIPMWMFAVAIACGNAFILKPSEKDPSVPVRLAELFIEAGGPPGILNVVHGGKAAVDAILEHQGISAVSFVGSSDIASYVYAIGAANGKRVQAMGGAKNHGIVLPDADLDAAVKDIVGAAYGSAGERCMALPVVAPVGKATADELRERLLAEIETLKVGVSTDPEAQYGPVVSAAHKKRVEDYIELGVREGRGAGARWPRLFPAGPRERLLHRPDACSTRSRRTCSSYQDEIFGPVLQIVRADTFEEALALPSDHHTATASPSSPATAAPRATSPPASTSAWSGSTCRSRCRSPTTPSAAGSARRSATPTCTAWRACASTPR